MKLCGRHLGAAPAPKGRKYSDATAARVADRHDAVFNRDAAFALAKFNLSRYPDIAAQALTLHFFFDQHLAFFAVSGFHLSRSPP
jgi:hypothetical protein